METESFPVINMEKLEGEERGVTMEVIKDACENWGFFELLNHGISPELLDNLERLNKEHYRNFLDQKFKESSTVKALEGANSSVNHMDWESTFFVRRLPESNLSEIAELSDEYRQVQ
ncbi:Aconitate hydratase mitochondrial [Asimina triloba]